MYTLDGKPISPDVGFEHGGVVYPPGWVRSATPKERDGLGLRWEDDPPPLDLRFYYDNGRRRPIEQPRAMIVADIKARAQSEIYNKYPIWRQLNAVSHGVEIATAELDGRVVTEPEREQLAKYQAMWLEIWRLREHSDALENEVQGLSFADLAKWQQHGWPEQGDLEP